MTSCHDCPEVENGTRKRAVCCRRAGLAARRAAAEAEVINRLQAKPKAGSRRLVRAAASSTTMLASGGAVHPSWAS